MIGPRDPGPLFLRRACVAAALAVLIASPALAADVAPPPEATASPAVSVDALYQQALDQYEHGDYAEAAKSLHDVLENSSGFPKEKKKRAWLYRGISLFVLGDRPGAEKAFWEVLDLESDFRPDPLFTLPAVVACFDAVARRHHDANPGTRQHSQDLARDPLGVPLTNDPNQRNFVDAISPVLPFGYAQYRNHQNGKALAIGFTEGALVLAITGTYVSFQTLRKPGDHFHPDEANVARLDKTVNNAAYVLLLGELVYGAIDGVYFNNAVPKRNAPRLAPGPGTVGLGLSVPF